MDQDQCFSAAKFQLAMSDGYRSSICDFNKGCFVDESLLSLHIASSCESNDHYSSTFRKHHSQSLKSETYTFYYCL